MCVKVVGGNVFLERKREREREISSCKNKEYKKAKSFIWML